MRGPALFLLSVALTSAAVAAKLRSEEREQAPPPPLPSVNMTIVAHHFGEAAVGLSCGAVGAWALRKLQSMAFALGVIGGIGGIAAMHLKWIHPDQVRHVGAALIRLLSAKVQEAAHLADMDDDGELTAEDSRIAYSKIAPSIRSHPALSAGAVMGFATVYSAMR